MKQDASIYGERKKLLRAMVKISVRLHVLAHTDILCEKCSRGKRQNRFFSHYRPILLEIIGDVTFALL